MAERRPDRTRGTVHDEFWAWCDRKELRLQRCATCGKVSWPAVEACEHCGSPELVWAPMSGRGRIVSDCTFERDYYRGLLPVPWTTILVELEEGPFFISNPAPMAQRDMAIGTPVEVEFIRWEDSAGEFNLPVFGTPAS